MPISRFEHPLRFLRSNQPVTLKKQRIAKKTPINIDAPIHYPAAEPRRKRKNTRHIRSLIGMSDTRGEAFRWKPRYNIKSAECRMRVERSDVRKKEKPKTNES